MRRRILLVSGLAAAAAPVHSAPPTLEDALRWLEELHRGTAVRTTGAWPLSGVLDHLAQSIEMSMDGYPEPRSALFQATAGSAAFAYFRWRGRMQHSLDEPIPGAPPLASGTDWKPAAQRLRSAIGRFYAHRGALQPHFAYGAMDKPDYALAHAMHIANHRLEVPGA